VQSQQLKSIHIDVGWTFSGGAPTGEYELILNGQQFRGLLNGGAIRVDLQLNRVSGFGHLSIAVTNGPMFSADVELGMPAIHTPEGLSQRLTNLGFYAGVRGERNGRALWAIRAFKRAAMNRFGSNRSETENDEVTPAFMEALQRAYGAHPNDNTNVSVTFGAATGAAGPCGMFGSLGFRRASFETAGAKDDSDPQGNGDTGIWAGTAARGVDEAIAGTFPIHLRAFDAAAGDSEIANRVNLPQPIHMAQFVLFELGYTLLRGTGGWETVDGTLTRKEFRPDGGFGRNTQWAVREFQCHAKMTHAAVEDVNSNELRYLPRLRSVGVALVGDAHYPANDRVSGVLNQRTRDALQAWADQALRCPVIIYASTDNASTTANGSDLSRLTHENIWLHDDHGSETDRVYAVDYSQYYRIPAAYGGQVSHGGHAFPRPIVIGQFADTDDTGPVSYPWSHHTWASADAEVRPDTMIGRGGLNGDGLSAQELSTFKVVRTAAHFECLGYFDSLNAYDKVTISFGPCHWTVAWCAGAGNQHKADLPREMPAFLAYVRNRYAADYQTCFGTFGLTPDGAWPVAMDAPSATYACTMRIDTDSGTQLLCGAATSQADNRYCKTWHAYYRFQMACRTSANLRLAMWDFSRMRIRDLLNKTLTIAGVARRIGDYVTSEKGTAMLLRWHIFNPGELFAHLQSVFSTVIPNHPTATQAREDAILLGLRDQAQNKAPQNDMNVHVPRIYGWANIPQQGLANASYYSLNLTSPTLSSILNSFQFAAL
jgi:hypothetical protein